MEMDMDFIDNRKQDPDFEPERKKHKKNNDIISNDLMLYIINKFGKGFYTETDKVERKLMCEMIRDDLITEKSVVIEQELIYENLMSQKRTFLREKKRTTNPQNAKWPFFEAFLSLGSCIRSESSSTSEKKHSKSGSSKSHSKSSHTKKSSSHKVNKKSSKDDSINSANEGVTGTGLKDLFGVSFSESITPVESDVAKSENDEKKEDTVNNAPSTSKSFNVLQSTPKAEKDNSHSAFRRRGFLFDNSVDVKDKLDLFFGKYDDDETLNKQVSDDGKKESKSPRKFKNQEEMIAYLDTMIPKSPKKDDAASKEPVNAQIDPMDYINPTQLSSEEPFASQYPATQPFPDSQEVEDMPHADEDGDASQINNLDKSIANNTMETIDDKNGQEKMMTDDDEPPIDNNNNDDQKKKTLNNIINEVFANKSFDKIDKSAETSDEIKELKELFNENESSVAAMLELEEKLFKLQQDMIKSELKFKAKLVEILEENNK